LSSASSHRGAAHWLTVAVPFHTATHRLLAHRGAVAGLHRVPAGHPGAGHVPAANAAPALTNTSHVPPRRCRRGPVAQAAEGRRKFMVLMRYALPVCTMAPLGMFCIRNTGQRARMLQAGGRWRARRISGAAGPV